MNDTKKREKHTIEFRAYKTHIFLWFFNLFISFSCLESSVIDVYLISHCECELGRYEVIESWNDLWIENRVAPKNLRATDTV